MTSGSVVCLIKPQFELRREDITRGGIVRDPALHERAVEKIRDSSPGARLRLARPHPLTHHRHRRKPGIPRLDQPSPSAKTPLLLEPLVADFGTTWPELGPRNFASKTVKFPVHLTSNERRQPTTVN